MSRVNDGSQFSFDFQPELPHVEDVVIPPEPPRAVEIHTAPVTVVRLDDHRRTKHLEVVRSLLAQTGVFTP